MIFRKWGGGQGRLKLFQKFNRFGSKPLDYHCIKWKFYWFLCSKWGPTEHASCFLRLLPWYLDGQLVVAQYIFKSPVLCFVRLVASSSSSAACLSSSWSQYVHRRGTSSSAERWKFSMHLHINTTISCSWAQPDVSMLFSRPLKIWGPGFHSSRRFKTMTFVGNFFTIFSSKCQF